MLATNLRGTCRLRTADSGRSTGTPKEVAALVAFLASDDAAFISGATYERQWGNVDAVGPALQTSLSRRRWKPRSLPLEPRPTQLEVVEMPTALAAWMGRPSRAKATTCPASSTRLAVLSEHESYDPHLDAAHDDRIAGPQIYGLSFRAVMARVGLVFADSGLDVGAGVLAEAKAHTRIRCRARMTYRSPPG